MSSNNGFSEIIAGVSPPLYCVNTQLEAPDQQTAKIYVFIEVSTLADDLINR